MIRDRKALRRDGYKAIFVGGSTIAVFAAVQSSVENLSTVWYPMQPKATDDLGIPGKAGKRATMVSQEKPGAGYVRFPSTRQAKQCEAKYG